jgi:hypothetical protein
MGLGLEMFGDGVSVCVLGLLNRSSLQMFSGFTCRGAEDVLSLRDI